MNELAHHVRAYAAEHRHENNMDIVLAWTDAQLHAVIARAKSARFAITLAWRAVRDLDRRDPKVVAAYGMPPVRAVSLHQYLAARGGLAPHPELAAIFDGPVWIGGYGPLVRRSGMALDDARRVAVEAGYLTDTAYSGGVATSSVNDLLDALSDEARGLKCYPYGERGEDPADFADDDPANYAEESCYDDIPF